MEVSILLELCSAIFISQGRNMIRLYYCAKDNELQIFFEGGDLLLSEVIWPEKLHPYKYWFTEDWKVQLIVESQTLSVM